MGGQQDPCSGQGEWVGLHGYRWQRASSNLPDHASLAAAFPAHPGAMASSVDARGPPPVT